MIVKIEAESDEVTGALVSETRYKPWGETRYSSGTSPTSYKYTGQREESSFGLYFYNARWYDPALGRFTSADSIVPAGVQGYDRYAYVSNNPLRYTDPTGHTVACNPMEDDCHHDSDPAPINNGGSGNHYDDDAPDDDGLIALACSAAQPSCWEDNTPQDPVPSTTFDDLVNYWRFSFEAHDFLRTVEFAENYGRPVYKHVKYSVSLLGLEYGVDGALQLYDDRNKNLNIPQRLIRGAVRSFESFVVDGASQAVGAASAIGTGSPLGYFAGAYFTSGVIDNLATNNLNPTLFNSSNPSLYLGGP